MVSKPCSKCHVNKPAKDFFRREQSHDGLQSWCRACKNQARRLPRPTTPAALSGAGVRLGGGGPHAAGGSCMQPH